MTTVSPASEPRRAPRRVRQPLSAHEPGAHMYASFGMQWRAGASSLLPFAVLYFATQPFGEAMALLTTGGYTIGPAVVAFFATGWALMSVGLLHLLRFNESVIAHYVTYALVGAATLLVVAMGSLVLVQLNQAGTTDFWNAVAFQRFLIGAPVLGALGSLVGRRVLAPGIHWHRWLERPPLPPVFDFVEGKRDKDEFERM